MSRQRRSWDCGVGTGTASKLEQCSPHSTLSRHTQQFPPRIFAPQGPQPFSVLLAEETGNMALAQVLQRGQGLVRWNSGRGNRVIRVLQVRQTDSRRAL